MNYEDIKQKVQSVQAQMTAFQKTLQAFEVTGTSGAGLVQLTLSGMGPVTKIDIDPSLLTGEEKEVLEDLLIAAFADARQKMEELASEEMEKMRSKMQLPTELNFSEM